MDMNFSATGHELSFQVDRRHSAVQSFLSGSAESSWRSSIQKRRRLKEDLQAAYGMLQLDGSLLRYETGNVYGRGDIAPFGFGMLFCIGDILTEPTEVVETRIDQSVQNLTEASEFVRFQDATRRENSAH